MQARGGIGGSIGGGHGAPCETAHEEREWLAKRRKQGNEGKGNGGGDANSWGWLPAAALVVGRGRRPRRSFGGRLVHGLLGPRAPGAAGGGRGNQGRRWLEGGDRQDFWIGDAQTDWMGIDPEVGDVVWRRRQGQTP